MPKGPFGADGIRFVDNDSKHDLSTFNNGNIATIFRELSMHSDVMSALKFLDAEN